MSILEILIASIIIILLVALGILFYQKRAQDNKVIPAGAQLQQANDNSSGQTSNTTITSGEYAGWKEYCSKYEKACFNYPNSWTITDDCKSDGALCADRESVTISSPSSSEVDFTSAVLERGGACETNTPHRINTEVNQLPKVSGLYVVTFTREDTEGTSIGIADKINNQTPKVGDTGTCYMYSGFAAKNTSQNTVDLSAHVSDSAKDADMSDVVKILNSYHYQ